MVYKHYFKWHQQPMIEYAFILLGTWASAIPLRDSNIGQNKPITFLKHSKWEVQQVSPSRIKASSKFKLLFVLSSPSENTSTIQANWSWQRYSFRLCEQPINSIEVEGVHWIATYTYRSFWKLLLVSTKVNEQNIECDDEHSFTIKIIRLPIEPVASTIIGLILNFRKC